MKNCKKPNEDEIKSVIVRHPKTASNLLKLVTRSKIITQELQTIEKPNIFDIESVTIKHWKLFTRLYKPIKQPKIISQKPNKINVYTESKAVDHTLKLELIKRHILPKNDHKVPKRIYYKWWGFLD